METLEIRSLSFCYTGSESPALDNISLTIRAGDFVLLCGQSGCGKSTLLRQLKPAITPAGKRSGEILLDGKPLGELDLAAQTSRIGFVTQSPDDQLVTDKVWHELAFGLESLGLESGEIRRRTAEMASFFGIRDWYHKSVSELSGGQKQLLNLASVMTMNPELLILDEPTSQLDPIAASDFIAALGKLNRELGTTIILTEHRPEDSFAFANRVAIMERGRLIASGSAVEVGEKLRETGSPTFLAMPAAMRVWSKIGFGECPVTVRDGRRWLGEFSKTHELLPLPEPPEPQFGEVLVSASDVWFRYERELPDVAKGLSLEVRRGEFLAILGSNGAGKTTALRLLAGLEKPYRGEIRLGGRVGALPQDPRTLFLKSTVREELSSMTDDREKLGEMISLCRLGELLDRHPYDLSGGEQQRAALAKVLLTSPDILLLDEPTKGLDAGFRKTLAAIISELKRRGTAIIAVSHDTEFCAAYADRCALFFDGSIVSEGRPREFFGGMSYYTTPANRMARGFSDAVTSDELILACGGECEDELPEAPSEPTKKLSEPQKKLPCWRKILAGASGISAIVCFVLALRTVDFTSMNEFGAIPDLRLCIALIASLTILAFALGNGDKNEPIKSESLQRKKLPKRTKAAAAMVLLAVPLTLWLGSNLTGDRSYYITALLVMLECMLPFFIVFEGRRPSSREIAVTAVLCALGVAGRTVFFMLPQFKPVLALTVIAGAAFGGETGFLVGAMTMLVSNMLFSQGPWTPWQMFAMGLVGFLAGILCESRLLKRSRGALCVFGGLAAIVVYGGIMNSASALIWQREVNFGVLLTYFATGFPMDCVHAAATVLFLWFGAEPMLEKLGRIKSKL